MSTLPTLEAAVAKTPVDQESAAKPKQSLVTSYTSAQILAEYEYGVEKDFKSSDGSPARWAPGQPKQRGGESKKINLSTAAEPGSISIDPSGSLIAVAVKQDIYIYSLATDELVETLSGHGEEVCQVAFCPQLSSREDGRQETILVSSSNAYRAGDRHPSIIIWNLDASGKDLNPSAPQPSVDSLTGVASAALIPQLVDHGWHEAEPAFEELKTGLTRAITNALLTHIRSHRTSITGTLFGFGSPIFSHDGSRLLFSTRNDSTQSGDRPDLDLPCINIYNIQNSVVEKQLRGHTDAIMWAGFSPNDKFIASVAWDGTVRIWDTTTGDTKHVLGSFGGQMWAGAFSPDSTHFAFSLGSPKTVIFVYSIGTGAEVSRSQDINRWVRTFDWSPDGSLLAAGGDDGQVFIWDPYTGMEKQNWQLAAGKDRFFRSMISVQDVEFVDDGRKLVFTTSTGSIEAYDFKSNQKYHIESGATAQHVFLPLCWIPSLRSLISANNSALSFWSLGDESNLETTPPRQVDDP
ncbi:vegetative incompatibility protein het-e-1 [Phlyctema vagabunda]|uniref:Vegetative incompatibility protein het-e-1 n=1 Tax=Phlyctema vagabunda TaxID=108571 RepID=A0ABR4PEX0_9HELO